jgi:hypothetical protein
VSSPDANTWLILIIQVAAFGGLWLRKRMESYYIRLMWLEYCEKHNIKENGGRK